MRSARSQSAMEYLMTYGWAILIIAVVLGALYSLGVFNAVNFMPKVPGGGCHVFRPNGPGTSWNVNLVGSCNNALPQYVARFNGQSGINAGNGASLQTANTITISVWVKTASNVAQKGIVQKISYWTNGWTMIMNNMYPAINFGGSCSWISPPKTINDGLWHHIVVSIANNQLYWYVDGVTSGPYSVSCAASFITTQPLQIGTYSGTNSNWNGSIANVQVYNTSLTANQVAYLYNEGIGGVPTSPQYLVGWWPLNGDTTDYSGNNNNGVPTSIAFNGTWTNGYNVP